MFDTDLMYGTIIEHINSGGLELLYKVMLETSKPEFCAALNTILQASLDDGTFPLRVKLVLG